MKEIKSETPTRRQFLRFGLGVGITFLLRGSGGPRQETSERDFDLVEKFLNKEGEMANPPRFTSQSGEKLRFNLVDSKDIEDQIAINDGNIEVHGLFLGNLIFNIGETKRFGLPSGDYQIGFFGFETEDKRVVIPFLIGEDLSTPFSLTLDHNGIVGDRSQGREILPEAKNRLLEFNRLNTRPCLLTVPCGRSSAESLVTPRDYFRFNHAAHGRSVLHGLQTNRQSPPLPGFGYYDLDFLPLVDRLKVFLSD